jgi:hypothetical protein
MIMMNKFESLFYRKPRRNISKEKRNNEKADRREKKTSSNVKTQ